VIDELLEVQKAGETVPGFRTGIQAEELIRLSYELEGDPVIMEIGAFLGRGAAYLAGARKLRGSGMVHTIDPFDNSGDPFSVPHYHRLLKEAGYTSGLQCLNDNIARLGLQDWVKVHQGTQQAIAAEWKQPIDFLFLDGDQSPAGARSAYENWAPFLKKGGILAVGNSAPRQYDPDHDGNFRVVTEEVVPEKYDDIRLVFLLTVARKR
jgi:predicted O-methyltransferase YrrM